MESFSYVTDEMNSHSQAAFQVPKPVLCTLHVGPKIEVLPISIEHTWYYCCIACCSGVFSGLATRTYRAIVEL